MNDFKNNLKQGDIIMHHAHGCVSNIIRKIDQSHYNHCSIYDKEGFLYEAVNGGIQRKKIEDSIKHQNTALITIFRVKNIDFNKSDLVSNYIKPILKNKFAYSQIVLIAAILWKRKRQLKGIKSSILNLIFLFYEKIMSGVIDNEDNNMTCSELVYRTYMDIAKKQQNLNFIIHIPLECSPIFILEDEEIVNTNPCDPDIYEKYNNDTANAYKKGNVIIEKATTYLKNLFSTKNYDTLSLAKHSIPFTQNKTDLLIKKSKKVNKILKKAKLYNFITPGDIVRSLDTYPVATYKTEKASKFKKCAICLN